MAKEIGSEYWQTKRMKGNDSYETSKTCDSESYSLMHCLSGRTALDFIVKDIKRSNDVNSVYLPSYCCHTMINPFLRNHIQVSFYEVVCRPNRGPLFLIDENKQYDIFYCMDYFGYGRQFDREIITRFREKGATIIEDKTHSAFVRGQSANILADYSFTSYRKWFFVPGIATAQKYFGNFQMHQSNQVNDQYINLRNEASQLKKEYIEKGRGDKSTFLEKYSAAEQLLENDYSGYIADFESKRILESVDYDELRNRRRENAQYLTYNVKGIKNVELMFAEVAEGDCPLFVPILVNENNRKAILKSLIDNKIYCPIHWPMSGEHCSISNQEIYNREISLICDQRYSLGDMKRIVETLNNSSKRT